MKTVSEETASFPYRTDLPQNNLGKGGITPELVRNITDRVYAMLIADLKIERERRPSRYEKVRYQGG